MLSQISGSMGKGSGTGHDVALVSAAVQPAQMLNTLPASRHLSGAM